MLAAVTVLAGCGKSKEREVFDEREAICNGFALGTSTVADTFTAYQFFPCEGGVSAGFSRMDPASADQCPYDGTPLHKRYYAWVANDPTLCSNFGCEYICEIRSPASASEPADLRLSTQPVCGRVFRRGLPLQICQ